MNTKRLTLMLLGVALMLGMAGKVQADSIPYVVSGTFDDGGMLSGTFSVDSTAILPVTAWNLITSGGSSGISGFTYNNITSLLLVNVGAWTLATNFGRVLSLSGYSPSLVGNTGPYEIRNIFEASGWVARSNANSGSGSAAAVPEPASMLLFGSGIAALGALRYRKDKKA